MKKHIITLGGLPGSGKSVTGKALATRLSFTRTSSGDFFRDIAAKRGISVEEINKVAEHDHSIDDETDAWVRAQGEKENLVIDSRLAFHWIPDAFNVFLTLDPRVAAERTYTQIHSEGRESQDGVSVEDVHQKTLERIESEKKRYQELYGLDYTDESHYDLVVDTGPNDLTVVTKTIADAYRKWLQE